MADSADTAQLYQVYVSMESKHTNKKKQGSGS